MSLIRYGSGGHYLAYVPNRQYLEYLRHPRKESSMKKMIDQHKKSLDRAILIMQMHADRQNVPKYKKEFVRDLERLNEIAELVNEHVNTPMFDHINDVACKLSV